MLPLDDGEWRAPGTGDLAAGTKRLDFTRPFLPETLARTAPLAGFLSPVERLTLNHIRGRTYLCLTARLEELSVDWPAAEGPASQAVDAGSRLARLREDFDRGFGCPCGEAPRLAEAAVLALRRLPRSQALAVCHLAGTAERHCRESLREGRDLDARFRSLLVHRFRQTAGLARLQTGGDSPPAPSPDDVKAALDEFLEGLATLEGDLERQVGVDLESLERAIGRQLAEKQQHLFRAVQERANRWTYLGAGLTEPGFLATVAQLGAAAVDRILAAASRY